MVGSVLRRARRLGAVSVVAGAGAVVAAAGGEQRATVSGTVSVAGAVPVGVAIDMQADRYCVEAQSGTPMTKPVIADGRGHVAGVLVYVKEGVRGEYDAPDEEVTLEQSDCRYLPSAVALQTGQTLRILNDDDTFHNVHVFAHTNRSFNIGQPMKGIQARRQFSDHEIGIEVKCDVHGWMQSYIHVLSHPHFDVTRDDGSFELGSLDPGNYVIEAWHPTLGTISRAIEVTQAQPVSLTLEFAR